MTGFVKPLMLSAFAAGSLALAGGSQDAPPPPPPAAALPPGGPGMPGGVTVTREGNRMVVAQGGVMGMGGMPGGPPDMMFARTPFGDDPRTRDLAKKLVDAKDDEVREKLRGELKAALAKAFDERQKGQERQVEELEKQLKRLKETIGKRKDAKADIIADRMTALEKEAKGLGW